MFLASGYVKTPGLALEQFLREKMSNISKAGMKAPWHLFMQNAGPTVLVQGLLLAGAILCVWAVWLSTNTWRIIKSRHGLGHRQL